MAFRTRFAAIAVTLLTLALFAASLLAGTEGAAAARYVVAQCGWHVGQDADWYDLSADRFAKSSYCQTPDSADPFDGVHLSSQVKGTVKTVGGTRFATWRWQAPPGTGIVNVHGQRWQYLREGFEHKLGGVASGGSFSPFLSLDQSDATKRDFWQGFSPYAQAFESRLVCFRQEDKVCDANGLILAGVRSLTISIDDPVKPTAQVSGGLAGTDWMRGPQSLSFTNRDSGAGLRFAETSIDGAIRARTEMTCGKVMISGQWRGTRMQPCPVTSTGTHLVETATLADGPHSMLHCAIDFSGNYGCSAGSTIKVDNNAPAAPKNLQVEGGDGWHRTNGFNLNWTDPDQGVASPVVASVHQLSGAGYQGGPSGTSGSGRIDGIQVPGPGEFQVKVWLVDQAGNVDETHSSEATLRFDDVPPTGYFVDPPENDPELIEVPVADAYSGVAGGSIAWRPAGGSDWHEIPSRYDTAGEPKLIARFPSGMPRGSWVLRASIADRAGNLTITDRRANGSLMTVKTPLRDETILTAGLSRSARSSSGSRAQVRYGKRALLGGRLTAIGDGGIGGVDLTVTEEPFTGSRKGATRRTVTTDPRGYFEIWLAAGPGRRVKVDFAGTRRLEESVSGALELRVTGRIHFKARPKRLRTGQKVRFRGRVAAQGAWHPTRGNVIQIQYFEESARRWRPVAVTRTDRNGRFRSGYRFRYITGLARIRLRALLIPSPRFPYGGAASKPVVIRVRG